MTVLSNTRVLMHQPSASIGADGDRWFTAEEALAYGFVDHVYGRN